ncbi:MAG: hypothetical protein PUC44_06690 [Eubacteriales bacterium]|nr:hypothetical protein [Eubacteriales bacterium]
MMHRKTVFKTSIFPSSEEKLWQNLLRPKMMQFISSPWVTLTPITSQEMTEEWVEGRTYRFQIRILGLIPSGTHTIIVEEIDPKEHEIRLQEFNFMIPVWNHTIYLRKVNESNTLFADKVEIFSGWKTPAIYHFAVRYFTACHRKIRTMLQTPEQSVPDILPDPKEELKEKAFSPKALLITAAAACAVTLVVSRRKNKRKK